MSVKNAMAFIGKVGSDEALRNRIKGLQSSSVEDLLKVAQSAGFSFTAQDWQTAAASALSGELSEGDLDKVAGGAADASIGLLLPAVQVLQPFYKPSAPASFNDKIGAWWNDY